MDRGQKIVAVIPARGGSKGIPKKNIKILCGKPLITWSIEAAKESRYIDEIVVSTENIEIAKVADCEGVEILWRPEKLATDTATTISVLQHVLEKIEADIVVLLQPTSPIRINNLIDKAIKRFLDSGADSLATGFISHMYGWDSSINNTPRQGLTGWFHDDGNVYVHKVAHLKEGKWFGDKREKMIIDKYYNLEIDDEIDFLITETLIKKYLKK